MSTTLKYIVNEAKDYADITIGLLLFSFAFTIFLLPYQIVTGGVGGIGAIIFYATDFPVQYTFFIINAVLILVALKILGWRFLLKTIYATVMITVFLEIAQGFITRPDGTLIKLMGEGNDFMSLVVGCIMTGTSLAIVFLKKGSTGGSDIVAAVINKYQDISLGRALIMIDFLIIGSAAFVPSFGDIEMRLQKVAFGLCTMVVECLTLDYVMHLTRQSVQFLIFSNKHKEISDAISQETGHSMTILDGHGYYTGREMKVICLLARKYEKTAIMSIIKNIDPDAFVSLSLVEGVYGEGFDIIKVKAKSVKSIFVKMHSTHESPNGQ